IRNAVKADIEYTAAQLVYGTTIRLPGEFVDPSSSSMNMDLTSYRNRLTSAMRPVKPASTRPQSTYIFVQPDLRYSTHVFVRRDSHRRPFESAYERSFKVLQRESKYYIVDKNGTNDSISIDRLKAAYLEGNPIHVDFPSVQSHNTTPTLMIPQSTTNIRGDTPNVSENKIKTTRSGRRVSHYSQYPAGTEFIYSYFESRGGRFPNSVFFGLQYILKKNLVGQHHKGYLPIIIKAVPEGTLVPTKNVLMTVENTDPKCYWLTTYLEVWYPMAVATNSRAMKQIIVKYLHETADEFSTEFRLHDFGFRGVSSIESAAIGGTAHLVNFKGTDSLVALLFARSAMTVWGEENETNAYSNLLNLYPDGTFACVSDSYDIWNACSNIWGEALRDKVRKSIQNIARQKQIELENGKVLGSKETHHLERNEKSIQLLPILCHFTVNF
ncbi:unnamed protein product, partial [Schistosoma curassoni]|uniref:Nicotinamide phosphoribosyltransferase n=1 Tax=Schistosoma curassoni TaxID=6186 RepID=A0A183K848_9TREM